MENPIICGHRWNLWTGIPGGMHYSGTPGMKPNPRLLVDLARAFAGERQVRVVAISEGPGAGFLKERQKSGVGSQGR
jgi:hypothetical protein